MISDITLHPEGILLRDESLFTGRADSASQPDSIEALCRIVAHCRDTGTPITVRGSLTAMNGAGVPLGGHTLHMERLNRVAYDPMTQTLWAQAGASFQNIEQAVRRGSNGLREFAAAPTEKTATLGGALSFPTSGIRALGHGTVASQVLELEYCDCTGTLHRVSRDSDTFSDLTGSEGMYAILTGARLATTPVPTENWALIFFLDSEEQAMTFAGKIRNLTCVTALEYMDSGCLNLLRTLGREIAAVARLPELPGSAAAAVYVELEAPDESRMEEYAEALLMELEEAGGDPDLSWSAASQEVERFRELHHAVQECINRKTAQYHSRDAAVTRLTYPVCAGGCESPLPDNRREALAAAGLEAVIFGHWDKQLPLGIHIFAEDAAKYREALDILACWYREDLAQNRAAPPHRGIGKVYRDIFVRETKKRIYDPQGLFNPGND